MMDTSKSQEMYRRAQLVIPKGVHGHYGYAVTDDAPVFFESSEGSRLLVSISTPRAMRAISMASRMRSSPSV